MIFLLIIMTLSSNTIEINEPLTVTLALPEKADIKLLRGTLIGSGDFMVIEEKEEGTTYTWKLEPLHAGTFPLSFYKVGNLYTPIEFVTVKPFNNPSKLPPPPFLPLTPEIPPSLSEANKKLLGEIGALQPERNLRLQEAKTFPLFSVLLALFLLSTGPLLYKMIEKRKKRLLLLTPEEKALKEIDQLNPQADPQACITQLSQTIRFFIQNKFGLNAPHLTTEEFLKSALQHPLLKGDYRAKLSLFLLAADQVKFAGHTPNSKEAASALACAKELIGFIVVKNNIGEGPNRQPPASHLK